MPPGLCRVLYVVGWPERRDAAAAQLPRAGQPWKRAGAQLDLLEELSPTVTSHSAPGAFTQRTVISEFSLKLSGLKHGFSYALVHQRVWSSDSCRCKGWAHFLSVFMYCNADLLTGGTLNLKLREERWNSRERTGVSEECDREERGWTKFKRADGTLVYS